LPLDKVARNRKNGPAIVGTFLEDLSIHGVFDVAGNGKEWTRGFFDGDVSIHDPAVIKSLASKQTPADATISLRGFEYSGEMSSEEVLKKVRSNSGYGTQSWTEPHFDIGFRVVIEP